MKLPARHPEWEPRLADLVDDWRPRAHQPRSGGDCAAFVLAAVAAVTGEVLAFEVRPYRTEAGQARALRELGWADLPAAADACFGERIAPLAAHRGDVVSDGQVLGVMTAGGPVAFGEDGMVAMDRRFLEAAWPIGRVEDSEVSG
jgi:hypothetical protein